MGVHKPGRTPRKAREIINFKQFDDLAQPSGNSTAPWSQQFWGDIWHSHAPRCTAWRTKSTRYRLISEKRLQPKRTPPAGWTRWVHRGHRGGSGFEWIGTCVYFEWLCLLWMVVYTLNGCVSRFDWLFPCSAVTPRHDQEASYQQVSVSWVMELHRTYLYELLVILVLFLLTIVFFTLLVAFFLPPSFLASPTNLQQNSWTWMTHCLATLHDWQYCPHHCTAAAPGSHLLVRLPAPLHHSQRKSSNLNFAGGIRIYDQKQVCAFFPAKRNKEVGNWGL